MLRARGRPPSHARAGALGVRPLCWIQALRQSIYSSVQPQLVGSFQNRTTRSRVQRPCFFRSICAFFWGDSPHHTFLNIIRLCLWMNDAVFLMSCTLVRMNSFKCDLTLWRRPVSSASRVLRLLTQRFTRNPHCRSRPVCAHRYLFSPNVSGCSTYWFVQRRQVWLTISLH